MKKIDLGQAITILANVGVIVGIAFLAVELRQNNDMMRAQTRNDITQSVVSLIRDSMDTEFLEIALKAIRNPAEMTEIETAKLRSALQIQFRTWENIHYQFRMGLFDDMEFGAEKVVWAAALQDPFVLAQWCPTREAYSPQFRRELDALLPTSGCAGIGTQN